MLRPWKMSFVMCTLLGLNPVKTHTIPANDMLKVKLLVYGHDYVMISCNIVSDVLASLVSTNLEQMSLLLMVPPPNSPGELVSYSLGSTGRLEIVQPTLDCMELSFTDKWGLPIYDSGPPEEWIRLDAVREELMNQTRKRLREHYQN